MVAVHATRVEDDVLRVWVEKNKVPFKMGSMVGDIDKMPVEERFRYWMDQFDKCVKCYGCRNVCPMCFCNECSLEEEDLVETGFLPTENPIFHLTRAVHMIGRCIDCGLCIPECPVHAIYTEDEVPAMRIA